MVSLKSVHVYGRVPSDLSKSTNSGGCLSLVAIALMGVLLVGNVLEFMQVKVSRQVEFDAELDDEITVRFNVTVPHLPCAYVSVEVVDALGTNVFNFTKGLKKFRLDATTADAPHKKLPYVEKLHHRFYIPANVPGAASFFETTRSLDPVQVETEDEFAQALRTHRAVIAIYGVHWCEFTQIVLAEAGKLRQQVASGGLSHFVEVVFVNCTNSAPHMSSSFAESRPELFRSDAYNSAAKRMYISGMKAESLCYKHHAIAYPTVRIYTEHSQLNAVEYVGKPEAAQIFSATRLILGKKDLKEEGDVLSPSEAVKELVSKAEPYMKRANGFGRGDKSSLDKDPERKQKITDFANEIRGLGESADAILALMQETVSITIGKAAVEAAADGFEGCELQGDMQLSRVPSSLRIAALASDQSIDPMLVNMSHFISDFRFGSDVRFEAAEAVRQDALMRERAVAKTKARIEQRASRRAKRRLEAAQGKVDSSKRESEEDARQEEEDQLALAQAIRAEKEAQEEMVRAGWALKAQEEKLQRKLEDSKEFRKLHLEPLSQQRFFSSVVYDEYTHYLKVVPASFGFADGTEADVYLYTTSNRVASRFGVDPRIIFSINLSPLRLIVKEETQTTVDFLSHTVAVIGGLFAVFGMIDGIIFRTGEMMGKKII